MLRFLTLGTLVALAQCNLRPDSDFLQVSVQASASKQGTDSSLVLTSELALPIISASEKTVPYILTKTLHLPPLNVTERIVYLALSLKESADHVRRSKLLADNLRVIPELEVVPTVNGYNKTETVAKLRDSGLHYEKLSDDNYGTLANFLTKFSVLKRQVRDQIPILCFLEDDVQLLPSFREIVEKYVHVLDHHDVNLLQLGEYGEIYCTRPVGAQRIVTRIEQTGILQNVDNQMRERCGVVALPEEPYRSYFNIDIRSKFGDLRKCPPISAAEYADLQQLNVHDTLRVPPKNSNGQFDFGGVFQGTFKVHLLGSTDAKSRDDDEM